MVKFPASIAVPLYVNRRTAMLSRSSYIYLNENRPRGVTRGLPTVKQKESQEQVPGSKLSSNSKMCSSSTSKLEGGQCPPSCSHSDAFRPPLGSPGGEVGVRFRSSKSFNIHWTIK